MVPKKKKSRTITPGVRHKWTETEIGEIRLIFKNYLKDKITPAAREIKKGIEMSKKKNGHIWKLKSENIKKKISWLNNRHKYVCGE